MDLLLERSLWQKCRGVKNWSRDPLAGVSSNLGERLMVSSVKLGSVHEEGHALLGESNAPSAVGKKCQPQSMGLQDTGPASKARSRRTC